MTIIAVTATDSLPTSTLWESPSTYQQLRSPVPKGLLRFDGNIDIPLLGSGDETNLTLSLLVPGGFAYLLRNFMMRISSDNLTNTFEVIGTGRYDRNGSEKVWFEVNSSGNFSNLAVKAQKIYVPAARTPKLLLTEPDGMTYRFADMASGGSAAGDAHWYTEFYIFELDQIDKWQVNSPLPVISHTSF